jgi:hypothetical protein
LPDPPHRCARVQECFQRSLCFDLALHKNDDLIGPAQRRPPIGDYQASTLPLQHVALKDPVPEHAFGLKVERSRKIIKDQQLG